MAEIETTKRETVEIEAPVQTWRSLRAFLKNRSELELSTKIAEAISCASVGETVSIEFSLPEEKDLLSSITDTTYEIIRAFEKLRVEIKRKTTIVLPPKRHY